jgi:hypothetical protein
MNGTERSPASNSPLAQLDRDNLSLALRAEADGIAERRRDSISSRVTDGGRLAMPDPRTAADWRAIESALLVDAEAWSTLSALTAPQTTLLPRLLAEDYAIRLARAYRDMAQAARDAAYTAGLYAMDAP